MKRLCLFALIVALVLSPACRSDRINYSQSLFEHIPDDPEILVLVRPNDIVKVAEMALNQIDFEELLGTNLDINTQTLDHYQKVILDMLSALGIPIESVESVGFMMYLKKPVLMVSGNFGREQLTAKLREIGFKQDDQGFFDYIYGDQKLHLPADGLMMMAEPDLLDFLTTVPEENRLWNRSDFSEYRLRSPMDNSLFIWTHPPDDFLSDFKYRDELGDVSFAMDFKRDVSMQLNVRLKSPDKTVLLYDIIFGSLKISQGLFGEDQDFGPLLKSIHVTQDNRQVIANLVIPYSKVDQIKKRLLSETQNNTTTTFEKLKSILERFD